MIKPSGFNTSSTAPELSSAVPPTRCASTSCASRREASPLSKSGRQAVKTIISAANHGGRLLLPRKGSTGDALMRPRCSIDMKYNSAHVQFRLDQTRRGHRMRRSDQQAGASAFDLAQRQFCAHQSPGLARPSASDPWRVLASVCARLTAPRIAEALAAAANEGSASSPSTLNTPSADARVQGSPARRNKRRRRRTCHSEPAAAASSGAAHANLYHRHSRHPQRRRPEIALVAIASGPTPTSPARRVASRIQRVSHDAIAPAQLGRRPPRPPPAGACPGGFSWTSDPWRVLASTRAHGGRNKHPPASRRRASPRLWPQQPAKGRLPAPAP